MNKTIKQGYFKVIIAGSCSFNNYDLLERMCNKFLSNIRDEVIEVVSGLARGADTLGVRYAKEYGYGVDFYPADWDKYKKIAGFIRNQEMAKNSDALIAFWDGKSPGTKDIIIKMIYQKKRIKVVNYVEHYIYNEKSMKTKLGI